MAGHLRHRPSRARRSHRDRLPRLWWARPPPRNKRGQDREPRPLFRLGRSRCRTVRSAAALSSVILACVEPTVADPQPTEQPRRLNPVRLVRRVIRGLFVHHAFDHAATMAFYFFLGTVPLLVLGGLLVGSVVEKEG